MAVPNSICYLILISTITTVLPVNSAIRIVVASFKRITDIIARDVREVSADLAAQATVIMPVKRLPSCRNIKRLSIKTSVQAKVSKYAQYVRYTLITFTHFNNVLMHNIAFTLIILLQQRNKNYVRF